MLQSGKSAGATAASSLAQSVSTTVQRSRQRIQGSKLWVCRPSSPIKSVLFLLMALLWFAQRSDLYEYCAIYLAAQIRSSICSIQHVLSFELLTLLLMSIEVTIPCHSLRNVPSLLSSPAFLFLPPHSLSLSRSFCGIGTHFAHTSA